MAMHANKRTHCATVPSAMNARVSAVCLPYTHSCSGVQRCTVAATCRRCCAACAATPSPLRASPASPVCLAIYIQRQLSHSLNKHGLRRRRAGFSAFNSMPRPISTAQGKRDTNRYCPHTRHNVNDSHTPCTIRAAAAHRVPSCGSGTGGWKRWERYEPARRLGQEPRSEEQRQRWDGGHADLECSAPSGLNRLEATMGYLPHTVLHTRGWYGLPTVQSE